MPILWTPEKIAEQSTENIKAIRKNAINKNANDVVALCDSELLKRAPPKAPSFGTKTKDRHTDPVVGYHFVCRPEEKGVTRNGDGTAWSGTWVVAPIQAEKSLKAGAYVALHLNHASPSYMKGNIRGWRRSKRERQYAEGQEVKTTEGTDFLLDLTDDQIEWRGQGNVERSYVYASNSDTKQ
jgi:hypothetical protein